MNGIRTLVREKSSRLISALVAGAALVLAARGAEGAVNTTVPGFVYHAQVTSYYCGSATLQMMLDNDAVRQGNPYVNWFLNPANAADPAPASFVGVTPIQDRTYGTIPFNGVNNVGQSIHPTFAPRVIPGVNNGNPVNAIVYGPQLALYDFAHGVSTFTPVAGPNAGVALSYFNPFQPWGAGSGINAVQYTLNVFDNPDVGGEGSHVFAAYNVLDHNVAQRTIANAILNYEVPAGGVFYGGQHAMAISGVQTDVAPGRNQPYTIKGFFVEDPWYEYAVRRGDPWGERGLPRHTFMSNEWGVGGVSWWDRIFTLSPGEPGEGNYAGGVGYKFVVEPQGPEPLDDGLFSSDPDPVPLLPSELTATEALALADQFLVDTGLSDKYGLSSGAFDAANLTLLDPAGESDWLAPYMRGGEYSGVLLIDSKFGILEMASWNDAGEEAFVLEELVAQFEGILAGWNPNDNPINVPIPEPSGLALIGFGVLLLSATRSRRRF